MNHGPNPIGVLIDKGPANWQILQQDASGQAAFELKGRWLLEAPPKSAQVLVRVLLEDTYEAATRPLACLRADTRADGSWSLRVAGVPRGGLYRVETALQIDGGAIEWARRGDMIHHLGVGDLWVITGQSNSAGYGKTPAVDGPELGIHFFHACGEWRLATHPLGDSTGTQYPPNREGANASHSPYLAFAKHLRRRLNYPIGLIPAALGGSPMVAWDRKDGGHLFNNMLAYIADATAHAQAAPRVAGMAWYQGESDTGAENRAVYLDRFARMVADFRACMDGPSLPVLTCQLNRYVGATRDNPVHEGWDIIREIQRQAARTLPHVHVVATADLGLSDVIHTDSTGNLVLGQRLASVALGSRYGLDVRHRHPDLASASRTGRAIDLRFDHVDERLSYENVDLQQLPFTLRDASGPVPVAKFSLPDARTFRLEAGRDLTGPVTVTGVPSACPPTVIPFDIAGYRPILGFTVTI